MGGVLNRVGSIWSVYTIIFIYSIFSTLLHKNFLPVQQETVHDVAVYLQ